MRRINGINRAVVLSKMLRHIFPGAVLALLFYLLFVPLSWLPAYNELKFPAAAGLLVVLLLKYPLRFCRLDIWYGIFLVAGVVSLFDIRHVSWAFHPLASWLLMILMIAALRPFFMRHRRLVMQVLQGVFWVTLSYLLVRMWQFRDADPHIMMTIVWPWQIFGKNTNIAPLVPLLLLPFVWYARFRHFAVGLPARLIGLLGVIALVRYFDFSMGWAILGAMTGISVVMLVPRRPRLVGVAGSVVLICLLFWSFVNPGSGEDKVLTAGSFPLRLSYDKIAFAIADDHPVNGSGLGSWPFISGGYVETEPGTRLLGQDDKKRLLGIYTRNYQKKNLLPEKFEAITVVGSFRDFYAYNHNYLTRLLAEIGLIGLLFWIGAPLAILSSLLNASVHQSRKRLRVALPYLGWVLSCLTMRMSVFDYIDLSEVQLIGMIGFGLWSAQFGASDGGASDGKESAHLSRTALRGGGVLLAIVLFIWFSHNFLVNHYQLKAMKLVEEQANCEAIELLEKWYHPVFRTTINDIDPIARHLARWSEEEGMAENAERWYREALRVSPTDPGLSYEYELFQKRNTPDPAEETAQ